MIKNSIPRTPRADRSCFASEGMSSVPGPSSSTSASGGGGGGESSRPPVPAPSKSTSAPGVVINRRRQQGNPLLQYIRVVRYEWGDCAADIVVDGTVGIVFLALSYHKLHNQYVHVRLMGRGENAYATKILLIVDNITTGSRHALRELALLAIRQGWTLIVTKGVEEAAEYVESLKIAENKDIPFGGWKRPNGPGARSGDERAQLADQAIRLVSGARGVTKTDAKRVLSAFGSLERLADAKEKDLALCGGIGPVRGPNLAAFLNTPFCS